MAPPVGKTLIIRFSSVGDIVLSSLLIRTFRKRFAESQIDFLVKSEYAELVRGNPHLTRILEFPAGGTFADLKHLRRKIRAAHYDLIVDIHGNLRSRFLTAGARRVVRYRKRSLARQALVRLKINTLASRNGAPPSIALRYLRPVRRLGVRDDGGGLELFIDDHDRSVAETIAAESGLSAPVVGIAPSARHWNKCWPAERFARAAAMLLPAGAGSVAILGAEHDREICRTVERELAALAPGLRAANLAGRMSLTQTAALMDRCDVVLANDSGLMHLAAARKRPLVALFGPTVREFGFFPLGTRSAVLEHHGLACRPCTTIGRRDCPAGHFRCMLDTTPEQAAAAARQVLTS